LLLSTAPCTSPCVLSSRSAVTPSLIARRYSVCIAAASISFIPPNSSRRSPAAYGVKRRLGRGSDSTISNRSPALPLTWATSRPCPPTPAPASYPARMRCRTAFESELRLDLGAGVSDAEHGCPRPLQCGGTCRRSARSRGPQSAAIGSRFQE